MMEAVMTVTRFVYRVTFGVKVHDTQTGLRACSCRLLPWMLEVKGDRYEYEMNVLLECPKVDIPIREVPIKTIYLDDNKSSHFDTVKDSVRIYDVNAILAVNGDFYGAQEFGYVIRNGVLYRDMAAEDGHYLFVVSDGRTSESEGLSLYEMAEFMQSLGAVIVYNLD